MKTVIKNLADLDEFAEPFVASLVREKRAIVVALHGELGAGKTTLSQHIARHLGVTETLQSPTFVIMKSYAIPADSRFTRLVHIDLYRVEDPSELSVLKFEELLASPETLILVEWAERAHVLMPHNALDVRIDVHEDESREITYVRQFVA